MKSRSLVAVVATLVAVALIAEAGTASELRVEMTGVLCQLFDAFELMAGAIASLIIVISGASWIKAQDNVGKRNEAKTRIIHTFIALALIVIAKSLVLAALGGGGSICTIRAGGDGPEIFIP